QSGSAAGTPADSGDTADVDDRCALATLAAGVIADPVANRLATGRGARRGDRSCRGTIVGMVKLAAVSAGDPGRRSRVRIGAHRPRHCGDLPIDPPSAAQRLVLLAFDP